MRARVKKKLTSERSEL